MKKNACSRYEAVPYRFKTARSKMVLFVSLSLLLLFGSGCVRSLPNRVVTPTATGSVPQNNIFGPTLSVSTTTAPAVPTQETPVPSRFQLFAPFINGGVGQASDQKSIQAAGHQYFLPWIVSVTLLGQEAAPVPETTPAVTQPAPTQPAPASTQPANPQPNGYASYLPSVQQGQPSAALPFIQDGQPSTASAVTPTATATEPAPTPSPSPSPVPPTSEVLIQASPPPLKLGGTLTLFGRPLGIEAPAYDLYVVDTGATNVGPLVRLDANNQVTSMGGSSQILELVSAQREPERGVFTLRAIAEGSTEVWITVNGMDTQHLVITVKK